ncbi:SDR family oxidoreductase [Chitinophaga agrisoli]|uniref:SDR family oxidoreductase n=1 Tax=Chitinophaga agrisoli TaxID=2607653 RepID=A0A5B2VM58_9BACT|nr:SDR family oxidoreductase [Chitinophaga agrisoli]KAA2239586.1 SDR family oxidoreductase [Chitinophaga agrisoli]
MNTIFITGASSGLGRAAVKLFRQKGWKVIATMRNPEKETELTSLSHVTVLPLDVTDEQQINDVAAKAIAQGKIDVVFNNAGYGLMGALEGTSDEQISKQIDTNLMGVIRVTRAFIPHFRENKGGMFLTTTSIGAHVTFPFSAIYHATKWALEGFSECLAFELKQFGIVVKNIAPGGIATDFAGRSMVFGKHAAYEESMSKMMQVLAGGPSIFEFSTPELIADVVYDAVTDGKDQLRYIAGPDAKAIYAQRLEQGDEIFRKGVAAMLLD